MANKTYIYFLIGHLVPGTLAFMWGLWHLLNIIKLHALNPRSYISLPWFPTSKIRYLELYVANLLFSLYIILPFIIPLKHFSKQFLPLVEHGVAALTFHMYTIFAILLDKLHPPAAYDLTNLLFAVAFGQELLMFHLHSTDHVGIEGQYHLLVQVSIFVTFATGLLSIKYPKSFLNGFVRSISVMLQGVWLILMGFMLWTPSLVPEGCYLKCEGDHWTVRCHGEEKLHHAKALVNLQFSLCVTGVIVFALTLYLVTVKLLYKRVALYETLTEFKEENVREDVGDGV